MLAYDAHSHFLDNPGTKWFLIPLNSLFIYLSAKNFFLVPNMTWGWAYLVPATMIYLLNWRVQVLIGMTVSEIFLHDTLDKVTIKLAGGKKYEALVENVAYTDIMSNRILIDYKPEG